MSAYLVGLLEGHGAWYRSSLKSINTSEPNLFISFPITGDTPARTHIVKAGGRSRFHQDGKTRIEVPTVPRLRGGFNFSRIIGGARCSYAHNER